MWRKDRFVWIEIGKKCWKLSTLSARDPVPGYRHKIMLCSHLENPICIYVHSYLISPCQTPLGNISLAASTKQRQTAHELTKTVCTQGPGAHHLNFSVGTWKKGVFTLASREYRTRASFPGIKCERCLRQNNAGRAKCKTQLLDFSKAETLLIRRTCLVQFLAQYVMSESDNHNEGGGIAWIRES